MSEVLKQLKTDWRMITIQSVVSAIVILSLASALSSLSGNNALAQRVDVNSRLAAQNVVIAKAGIDTVICILSIQPENRTDARIRDCMTQHGYLPYFTGPVRP